MLVLLDETKLKNILDLNAYFKKMGIKHFNLLENLFTSKSYFPVFKMQRMISKIRLLLKKGITQGPETYDNFIIDTCFQF